VQEPAIITLPVYAQNVLIINNTVTQPNDFGINITLNGNSINADHSRLSLDSMVWKTIDEIAIILDESHFFNTIASHREPIRNDSDWLTLPFISPEQQNDFYEADNYDALFVIERLMFYVKEEITINKVGNSFRDSYSYVDLRLDGVIVCSIYVYENTKPLISFNVADSLLYKFMVYNDSTTVLKEIPEAMLNILSTELGNNVAKCLIPLWSTKDRNLFVNISSRMQEAVGYAADSKWANAELIWLTEIDKKTKPADKAKIAYNLAVANEMQDKFYPALEWVQKAKEYIKNEKSNNNQINELIDKYIPKLEQRIESNKLLDLQWGRE